MMYNASEAIKAYELGQQNAASRIVGCIMKVVEEVCPYVTNVNVTYENLLHYRISKDKYKTLWDVISLLRAKGFSATPYEPRFWSKPKPAYDPPTYSCDIGTWDEYKNQTDTFWKPYIHLDWSK